MSFVIAKVIDLAIGLRVTPEQEQECLDRSQHAETAYAFTGALSSLGAPTHHGQSAPQRAEA